MLEIGVEMGAINGKSISWVALKKHCWQTLNMICKTGDQTLEVFIQFEKP